MAEADPARVGAALRSTVAGEPRLSALLSYWEDLHGYASLPPKRRLDPLDLPRRILPILTLMELSEGGRRFYCRLCGTEVVNRYGRDPTGQFDVEILAGPHLDYVRSLVHHVCASRKPVLSETVAAGSTGRTTPIRRLCLPFADDQGAVGFILLGYAFPPLHGQLPPGLLSTSFQETLRLGSDADSR